MQIDLEKMLHKIKDSQWALADFDWDAPGAELVTENAELYPKLKTFMADLMWIEHVGEFVVIDGDPLPGHVDMTYAQGRVVAQLDDVMLVNDFERGLTGLHQ